MTANVSAVRAAAAALGLLAALTLPDCLGLSVCVLHSAVADFAEDKVCMN